MTSKNLFLFLACGFLSGCQTSEGYRQLLESYKGSSEQQIVRDWGVPNNSYTMDNGGKVLQYNQSETYVIPGITTTTPQTTYHTGNVYSQYGGRMMGTYSGSSTSYVTKTSPDTIINETCQTSFLLNPKRVMVDYTFAGSGCVANESDISPEAERQARAIEECGHKLPAGTTGPKFKKCVEAQMEAGR